MALADDRRAICFLYNRAQASCCAALCRCYIVLLGAALLPCCCAAALSCCAELWHCVIALGDCSRRCCAELLRCVVVPRSCCNPHMCRALALYCCAELLNCVARSCCLPAGECQKVDQTLRPLVLLFCEGPHRPQALNQEFQQMRYQICRRCVLEQFEFDRKSVAYPME